MTRSSTWNPTTPAIPRSAASRHAPACAGYSSVRWINGEDRLNYPMKRVEGSKRGEGKYEQISWDEALDTIASEFKRITETYGNESVFIQECSGVGQET